MTITDKAHRQQLVWGIVGVLAAVVGFILARKLSFTSAHGKGVGFNQYQLHFMAYNQLGAVVGIVLSGIGISAGLLRKSFLSWIAAAGFAVVALQTVVQWRVNEKTNIFGSDGATMAFSIAMLVLYAMTALVTSKAMAETPASA
jgi:hypothetical protein